MQRVETSVLVEATREEVLSTLSPRSIVEHEGTFEVTGVEETPDGTLVRALAAEHDLEAEFLFTELSNGYGYEQTGAGPFEELYTSISVGEHDGPDPADRPDVAVDNPARVTMRSRFTFGGRFARLKDWFAASTRRKELQRALFSLAEDVAERSEGVAKPEADPESV